MMVRPYGDTADDGMVQLSFTLPLADSPETREAARRFVLKLGFQSAEIVEAAPLTAGFTMFVAYGKTTLGVDPAEVKLDPGLPLKRMSFEQVNEFIRERLGRKLKVIGATIGYDAHTVGIDAILNMKGFDHHFGLERYPMIEAVNLGAQVEIEKLLDAAVAQDADAILVSQVVTQRDAHLKNLKEFMERLKARGLRERFIVLVGGPRISHQLATELGFDAGFSKGTYPEDVATFIAERVADREEK